MAVAVKRKRGRPSNDEIEARLIQRLVDSGRLLPEEPVIDKTDDELLDDIKERFRVMEILVDGAILGNIRSMMIAGASGIGKTFTLQKKLHDANTFKDTRYEIVSGGISAIGLYKLGYKMRDANRVIVLDDSDDIYSEDATLSILKVMCDSSKYRTVHWLKESAALKDGDETIPTSYEFNGSIIFVTNQNIQQMILDDRNKFVPHLKALVSRSLYLDLLIHNRHQLGVWINHIAHTAGLFDEFDFTKAECDRILKFVNDHRERVWSLDLRTVVNACEIYKTDPGNFEMIARNTILQGAN